jgi:RHS repeat-associated protein
LLDAGAQGQREVTGTLIRRAGNIRYQHDRQGRVTQRQRIRISRRPDTWHYEWDADDRLISVGAPDGTTWRYKYDPFGRRTAKEHLSPNGDVSERTDFTWDGAILVEQTAPRLGTDQRGILTWNYQPGSFTPLTQTEHTSLDDVSQAEIDQRFYAIITDLVGTPTELAGPDGALAGHEIQTLWGGTTWPSDGAQTPLRFPGQYEDPETGLHYNNQRYYDPVTGGYLSPDLLGLAPALNQHAYVQNPHISIDPFGLKKTCNLRSGNNPTATRGMQVHNSPEWAAHLSWLGYQPGRQVAPGDIPDGIINNSYPVELKHDTPTGMRAGTRQLRRYITAMGTDHGELWLWSDTPNGIEFRLGAVPKPGSSRRWYKF